MTQNLFAEANWAGWLLQADFLPHRQCYLGNPPLIWTMFTTDLMIGSAYIAIALILLWLIQKIQIPFSPVVLCFGVFIGACGLTHLMEVWTLWYPKYWAAAGVKAVTALASVGTGIYLYRLRAPILQIADTYATDRKRLTDELQRHVQELESKSALLETILQQMPMAVVFAEAPSGRLFFANKQLHKVWRHGFIPSDDVDGYREYIGFHKDGRRYEGKDWPLARAIQKGETVINEDSDVLLGDGTRGTLRISAAPVRNPAGEIIAGVVISEDVTDRIRIQKDLQQAKEQAERANHLKSAFLANMSHEIRTPLGAMLGFAELLRDPNLSEGDRAKYTEVLTRNGEQLSSIINDILDLSKVEAGYLILEVSKFDPVAIARDAASLFEMQANKKALSLEVWSEEPQLTLTSDEVRVRQILMNLVGNAIKFTETGSIQIRVSAAPAHSGVRFDVIDTGIGVSRDTVETIFDMFVQGDGSTTRKFGGTGLGLALSRRLARELGGDVTVTSSELGIGSTFSLVLPNQSGASIS